MLRFVRDKLVDVQAPCLVASSCRRSEPRARRACVPWPGPRPAVGIHGLGSPAGSWRGWPHRR
eukprot:12643702-Alexandrium_andersonii.AAC.1